MMVAPTILLCCEVLRYIGHTMNLNPYIRNKIFTKQNLELFGFTLTYIQMKSRFQMIVGSRAAPHPIFFNDWLI